MCIKNLFVAFKLNAFHTLKIYLILKYLGTYSAALGPGGTGP